MRFFERGTSLAVSVVLLFALGGCGDDDASPLTLDAGRLPDAGRTLDAGAGVDAGSQDASGGDAGAGDASAEDAGSGDAGAADASVADAGMAVPCPAGSGGLDLATGSDHTCAIREDGTLLCWGANDHGQLGLGAGVAAADAPTAVGAATDWDSVRAGVDYTCGLRAGALYCWGHNMYGRLGVDDRADRDVPTRVGDATDWTSISVGAYHTCGLRTGGNLYCWGHNSSGRLGLDDTMDRLVPTPVGGTGWVGVSAGGSHTCALDDDGAIWCWGGNGDGQLGLGEAARGMDHRTPTLLAPATGWTEVSTGSSHACGVRTDGSLWCWGSNGVGQLGLGAGAPVRASEPTRVGSGTDWSTVVGGSLRTCARRLDGSLWCWGSNGGALGTGDDVRRDAPAAVLAPAGWPRYSGGSGHTCGITTAGAVWCWGRNRDGQLGVGDAALRLVPARVCL
jgi:alpha-tubulin suppressor-like RCC1 family protein